MWYLGNSIEYGSFLGYGRIFGSVIEDNAPKVNTPVYLVALGPSDTPFTIPIGYTVTDNEGKFNFVGVSPYRNDYAVIVTDNTEPYKIAKICDKLTPVEDLSLANWFAQSCLYGAHYRVFIGNLFDAYDVRARCSTSLGGQIRTIREYNNYIPIAVQLFTQDSLPYPRINSISHESEFAFLPPSERIIPLVAHGAPTAHTSTQSDLTQQSFECFINVDAFSSSEAIEQTIVWDIVSYAYDSDPIIRIGVSYVYAFCRFAVKFLYDTVYNRPIVRLVVRPTHAWYLNLFDAPGTYFDFDLSGYSGYIHLMLVIDVSTSIKLFVNGSLVSSQSTTITFDALNNSVPGYVVVLPYSAARVFDLIYYAVYPYVLTNAQVSDLYAKINLRDGYVLSKYHQTALSYHPLRYYKFDDAVSNGSCRMLLTYGDDNSKAHLVPTTTNTSDYLFSELSPVAGSASVRLFGSSDSYLIAERGAPLTFGSENTLSLTCWIKLANLPTDLAYILSAMMADIPAVEFLIVSDGYLLMRVYDSTYSLNEYQLSTVLNVNTWYFVTCVVSLHRRTELSYVKLYLGTDVSQPTLQVEVNPHTVRLPTIYQNAGLYLYYNNAPQQLFVGKNFDGWISELGWFPSALSETQILKLWEARNG